jgi:DNA repair protein radC
MEEKHKLNIKEWAEEDRPREKMLSKGVTSLSDAELLAILIGSGNTTETAVELTRRILVSCNNNLNELGKRSISDLCVFKGIGEAKAISITAALELGKRRKLANAEERKTITCSTDIYHIFQPLMCDLPTEEFWIVLLNQSNKIIDRIKISSGGITETSADIRSILREALLRRATSIILCHNHPSGNRHPSQADDRLTDKVHQATRIMDIQLHDHLIICEGTYYSYADEGRI